MKNELDRINPNDENIMIIPCPPVSQFKDQPKDQSLCIKTPCKYCNELMWLSENKQLKSIELQSQNIEPIVLCYICLDKFMKDNF